MAIFLNKIFSEFTHSFCKIDYFRDGVTITKTAKLTKRMYGLTLIFQKDQLLFCYFFVVFFSSFLFTQFLSDAQKCNVQFPFVVRPGRLGTTLQLGCNLGPFPPVGITFKIKLTH